jgi:integration host factor subunit beta
MATTTKRDLIERIASETSYSRQEVRDLVKKVFDIITDELASGNRIEFRQFGVFEVRERRARTAKNPRTNERFEVPSRVTVRFKPGQDLKAEVNRRNGAVPDVVVTTSQTAV